MKPLKPLTTCSSCATAFDMYYVCAGNRMLHDLVVECGYGYGSYLDYLWYAELRWKHRGER
jgi:hypothetical protein